MPVSAQVRRRCQQLLGSGESIHYLIPTMSVGIGVATSTYDCYVVVTDRRIVVVTGSMFDRTTPSDLNAQYPRATRLGPVELAPVPTFHLGGRFYEIDDEYIAAVHAADAELDGPDAFPPDPFQ